MGRAPCCDKTKVKRGPWSPEEDATLKNYVENYGTGGNWIALPQKAGLKRCGKSCRLRWLNYLRPNIKHGGFSEEEDRIILSLYRNIGSRWSVIASQLPGRTDNDVKNYWNTKLKKKLLATSPPPTTVPASFTGNSFVNFDQPAQLLDTLYVSELDFPVDTTNLLPYYPMDRNQDMFINQLPLPGLIDVVAGNPSYNSGLLSPAADPLHYNETVLSFSPPFSWSSGEESSFLADSLPYNNLLNAVDFHENLDHVTCVGGFTNHFANIG